MSGRTSPSSTPTTSPASSSGADATGNPGGDLLRALPRGLVALAVGAAAAVLALYLLVVRTYWGQRLDEHAFVGHDFFASRAAQADSFLRIVSIGSLVLAVVLVADPDDAAAQAIRQAARGIIALSPIELPVLQAPAPAAAPQPAGMSLPMA